MAAKRIPYGVSDFLDVIQYNMYYVDKSMYIPLIEEAAQNVFLIRPRRFGKSLLLSMVKAYYDKSMIDQFDELFGNLWIGSHPTEFRGKYQVLSLDFSQAAAGTGTLEENFNQYCLRALQDMAETYKDDYSERTRKFLDETTSYSDAMSLIFNEAKRKRFHLYLILDEYDSFTNNVLNEKGTAVYHALTHASGFYRDVFKRFKSNFQRILMMGVSPVTMDDLTSGFNMGMNISIKSKFNQLMGFSTEEVREMFQYYQQQGLLQGDIEAMIAEMKPWYNNYCFAEDSLKSESRMFNSDMVLYYLKERVETGHSPKNMLDYNTKTDYTKIRKLLDLDHMDGDRKSIIQQITEEGQIVADLFPTFPAQELVNADVFPSLLYYYGMLTLVGTNGNKMILGIPNNNVRIQYYGYMLELYKLNDTLIDLTLNESQKKMTFEGDWLPLFKYMAEAYRTNSSVRSQIEGERNIQGFFTALLSLNTYYLIAPEMELNHGYCDLFLMPDHQRYPEVSHSYIIELKYLPTKDLDAKAEKQWEEAVQQIKQYAEGAKVKQMIDGTQLHLVIIQFSGWEAVRMEEV